MTPKEKNRIRERKRYREDAAYRERQLRLKRERAANDPAHREYRRAIAQRWRRTAKYGLAEGEFERMLSDQKGQCALCESNFENGPDTHIDHDHETGIVRGLLCRQCNTFLSVVDRVGLSKIAAYIKSEPK